MLCPILPQFEDFAGAPWTILASRWQSEDREAERQRKLAERVHRHSEVDNQTKMASSSGGEVSDRVQHQRKGSA